MYDTSNSNSNIKIDPYSSYQIHDEVWTGALILSVLQQHLIFPPQQPKHQDQKHQETCMYSNHGIVNPQVIKADIDVEGDLRLVAMDNDQTNVITLYIKQTNDVQLIKLACEKFLHDRNETEHEAAMLKEETQ